MRLFVSACFLIASAACQAQASDPNIHITAARSSLTGQWEGTLEYLDYGANQWFGIPVKTRIEDQGDGATIIRKSDFDDGPVIGNVRITSVELFEKSTSTVAVGTFRKGRAVETSKYQVRLDDGAADAQNWTMIEETLGRDDNRPAMIRLTTVRKGISIETLKQVDFQDDDKAEWLSRNRTRLTRIGD